MKSSFLPNYGGPNYGDLQVCLHLNFCIQVNFRLHFCNDFLSTYEFSYTHDFSYTDEYSSTIFRNMYRNPGFFRLQGIKVL